MENSVPDSRAPRRLSAISSTATAAATQGSCPLMIGNDRLGVLDSGGDGDRDGQDIVHQQRRSNGKASIGPRLTVATS